MASIAQVIFMDIYEEASVLNEMLRDLRDSIKHRSLSPVEVMNEINSLTDIATRLQTRLNPIMFRSMWMCKEDRNAIEDVIDVLARVKSINQSISLIDMNHDGSFYKHALNAIEFNDF